MFQDKKILPSERLRYIKILHENVHYELPEDICIPQEIYLLYSKNGNKKWKKKYKTEDYKN